MSDPDPGRLASRADALAEEGAWQELHDVLAPLEDELLDRPALAYRYGEALYHTARFGRLETFAARLEERARAEADARTLMQALNLAFVARFELGELEEARGKGQALVELAEAEGHDGLLAKGANNMGLIHSLEGDWEQALSCFRLALPLYERTAAGRGLAQTHHNLGNAFRYLGRPDESDRAYREAAELAEKIGYPFMSAMATLGRADLERIRGHPEVARRLVERGLRQARSVGDPVTRADGLRIRGLLRASGTEEAAGALEDLRRARELADGSGSDLLTAEIDKDTGAVLAELGRVDEARKSLESAIASFTELGARMEAERAREHLDDLDGGEP